MRQESIKLRARVGSRISESGGALKWDVESWGGSTEGGFFPVPLAHCLCSQLRSLDNKSQEVCGSLVFAGRKC